VGSRRALCKNRELKKSKALEVSVLFEPRNVQTPEGWPEATPWYVAKQVWKYQNKNFTDNCMVRI
jgi:hypothetical protein